MNAGQLLVSCLESEGVRFAFGIPGEENLELMDALRGSSVRFVLTRHEGAAAFMADVYGRLSGRAGVCLATLGPGATNLVTGVADAFLDRAPLVAITAQANLSTIHRESHQYVDILQLFGPITKWNARVESPDVVPEIVRKAFKLAEAEKPGSTHVELPENVAEEEADPNQKPLPREPVSAPTPARASVEQATLLMEKAVRPVILAGNGVIRNGSSSELTQLAERLQIPVVTTVMGKGAIPWTSPMSLLTIGILPRDYELAGFDDSDLVICIGYDFVEYDPRTWNPRGDRPIVHIDALPAEISAHYLPEVEDDHHLERPFPDGHRAPGRRRSQTHGAEPPGRHTEWRRRISHERSRVGDREARARCDRESGLPGRRAGEHSMETDCQVQTNRRHRLRKSGFSRSCESLRSSRFRDRLSVGIEFRPSGGVRIECSVCRGYPGGLREKSLPRSPELAA